MTDPQTLRTLAAELCEYRPDGTKVMDRKIAVSHGWLRVPPSQSRRKHGHWLSPEYVINGKPRMGETELSSDVPDFTTSLDAALPGEDIVAVWAPGFGPRADGDKWVAVHRWPAYPVTAHTEPLARRAAALLAMAERKEREG